MKERRRQTAKKLREKLSLLLETAEDDWEREFLRQAVYYVHLWGRHIQPEWQKKLRKSLPTSFPGSSDTSE